MPEKEKDFSEVPFPRQRQLVLDAGWLGRRRPMIHGFIEVDVTAARQAIRRHAAQGGEKLSFTAFLIFCVGQAVAADKSLNAYRNWRNRLIIFDDVDVLISVEIQTEDGPFPLLHPIRAANRRTVREIHDEIRRVQSRPRDVGNTNSRLLRNFYWLPAVLRRLLYRLFEKQVHWRRSYAGTVGLTSLGMFGSSGGWGLGLPIHTLAITVGGIAQKPRLVNGRVEQRDLLAVTVSVDHDIVDGAPAARFAQRFTDLVEAGTGLPGQ